MSRDFEGKVALVSGSSRGLGFAVAEALGASGAHVIALARTVGGLEELDDSIREKGLVQPLIVREADENKYEIVAGERRWRASQLAGLQKIPAVVRDVPDEAAIAMALIEDGLSREGEWLDFPVGKEDVIRAQIVSPVFYDVKGEKPNV